MVQSLIYIIYCHILSIWNPFRCNICIPGCETNIHTTFTSNYYIW